MTERAYFPVPFSDVRIAGPFWRERLEVVLERTIPSQHAKLDEVGILESAKCRSRLRRSGSQGTATASRCRCSGIRTSANGSRRRAMRSRTVATRPSKPRSRRSSTISSGSSRPTAISTAGTSAVSPRSAGPTCATITSSIAPGTCSKARSPIIAPPAGGGSSTSWSATSITSRRIFGRGPGQKRGYCGHQEIELALVKLYRLTGDRRRLDLAAYFIDERGRQPHYFTEEALARGDDPARLLGQDLRIQSVAHAGARADEDGRPRGPRDVHGLSGGRSRLRARRRWLSSGRAKRCGAT